MCNTGSTINREQWKRGGDCRLCRRQPYCKKVCKAHQRRTDNWMGRMIAHSMAQALTRKPDEKKEGTSDDSIR